VKRLKALRALRWNYTRKGVWVWLVGWQEPGKRRHVRGYRRILSEPERVVAEQTAVAEGVFV
jgi:hypothetical protein